MIHRKIKAKARQGVGKLRRLIISKFCHNYIKEQEQAREGDCVRCGACCKLLFNCPFLVEQEDGNFSCKIHEIKPKNCRIFPIDAHDIKDRNTKFPDVKCGFHFPNKNEK